MSAIKSYFELNGQTWSGAQLERLEYERNLHILHQLKQHEIEIIDGNKVLDDDDIDYLSMKDAWRISIETRSRYSGEEIAEKYKDSLAKADEMWKRLGFALDRPMKISVCTMNVEGMTMQEYLGVVKAMQADEKVGLSAHPEHFMAIVEEDQVIGIESFGMYGTPTLVNVDVCPPEKLGEYIMKDRREDYPIVMAGFATLTDGKTLVNCPMHQFKPLPNGFEAIMAVYWPEHTPDEIVDGHCLHLAMEFYEGLRYMESKVGK